MTALDRQTRTFHPDDLRTFGHALIDVAGLENGPDILAEAGLKSVSLLSGADAVLLAAEAPVLVDLGGADPEGFPAIQAALDSQAAVLLQGDAPTDAIRRHWRKWLSAYPAEGDDLVTFRFQDPRVLAAFALTLLPAEVEAFMGPLDAISVVRGDTMTTFRRAGDFVAPADSLRLGNGTFFTMRPFQVEAMREVVSDAFKDDLFRFYRKIFDAETAHLSDADLRGRIEQTVADTRRMGSMKEQDLIRMSSVRVLRPDLANDEWVWEQVMTHESNDPGARALVFQLYLKSDLDAEAREKFEGLMGVFGLDGFY